MEPASNLVQELQSKSDIRIKNELPSSKGTDQLKYKGSITDQLEASSSGTSYLDASTIQQSFPLPTFCLDGDVQSNNRNNLSFGANIDGLTPDTLLSRGYDSQKDLQNLLSNCGGAPRDIETELSTAAISSQSFGVPNMPFKPGCSSDVAINDAGVLSNGLWANQTQRMRTYTKVLCTSMMSFLVHPFKSIVHKLHFITLFSNLHRFKSVVLWEDALMLHAIKGMMNSDMIWLACLVLKGN